MTTICRDWFSGTARSARDSGKFEKQKNTRTEARGKKQVGGSSRNRGFAGCLNHAPMPTPHGRSRASVPIHWLICNAGQIISWSHALPFPLSGPHSRPARLGPARSGVSGKPYRRLSRDKGGFGWMEGAAAARGTRKSKEPR